MLFQLIVSMAVVILGLTIFFVTRELEKHPKLLKTVSHFFVGTKKPERQNLSTLQVWKRETGVGPATSTLARSRSTTELFPQKAKFSS